MLKIIGRLKEFAQLVELESGRPAGRSREYTAEDPALVSRVLALRDVEPVVVSDAGDVTVRVVDEWYHVPVDVADAVSLCEADAASRREARAADRAEAEAEDRAATEAWLALPAPTPAELGPEAPQQSWGVDLPPEIAASRRARVEAREASRREAQRLADAAKVAAAAAEAARERRAQELLVQLAQASGDPTAAERIAAGIAAAPETAPLGYLPRAEAEALARHRLLPIAPGELEAYVPLTTRDVRGHCIGDDNYEHPDIMFRVFTPAELGGLSADEWRVAQGVTAQVPALEARAGELCGDVPVTFATEIRGHRGQCRERDCPDWPVRRVGVLVRVVVDGALVLEREYGAV